MLAISIGRSLLATTASAIAFWLLNALQIFLGVGVDLGVDNPYLPAGVRLIAVTVFGVAGGLGLVLGSLVVGISAFPDASLGVLVGLALLNGLVPLLSLHLVRRLFGIGDDLFELSFRSLVVLIALLSVLSPIAHQVFFLVTGLAHASYYNLAVMIVGDTIGSVLVLLVVALVWSWFRPRA